MEQWQESIVEHFNTPLLHSSTINELDDARLCFMLRRFRRLETRSRRTGAREDRQVDALPTDWKVQPKI